MMGPTGPGPWDPAYGYPLGTGPSTGTPAPQPPPDTPPPSQSNAAPGPTPQPPPVTQTPPSPPPSLGDVTKDIQSQPPLDIQKNFDTYLDLQKRAMAGAERPYLSESTKPGLLRNILTFGMAGLMDQDYRTAYNAAIDSHNSKVHAEAVKNALTMVGDDVKQHGGDIGTQIRMLGLYQQMLNAQNTELYRRQVIDLRKRGIDISGARLGLAGQEFTFKQMMRAPNETERAILEDNGLVYVEDPGHPGYGWPVPKGSPFAKGAKPAAAPPAATPPADTAKPPAATGDLGTSGTTSGGVKYRVVQPGQPTTPNPPAGGGGQNVADPNEPGISAQEKLRRQKLAEKTAAEPLPADVQKQVSMIDESIAGLNELEKLAQDPEVRKWIGPGMSRMISEPAYYTGFGVSPKVNRFIQLTNYLNSQAVGPLLHGSRNEKIWAQIQAHLPKATDDPDFALDKIRQARTIYQTNRGIELGSTGITRGQAGTMSP